MADYTGEKVNRFCGVVMAILVVLCVMGIVSVSLSNSKITKLQNALKMYQTNYNDFDSAFNAGFVQGAEQMNKFHKTSEAVETAYQAGYNDGLSKKSESLPITSN